MCAFYLRITTCNVALSGAFTRVVYPTNDAPSILSQKCLNIYRWKHASPGPQYQREMMTPWQQLCGAAWPWKSASVITTKTVSLLSKPNIITDNFPLVSHPSWHILSFERKSAQTLAGRWGMRCGWGVGLTPASVRDETSDNDHEQGWICLYAFHKSHCEMSESSGKGWVWDTRVLGKGCTFHQNYSSGPEDHFYGDKCKLILNVLNIKVDSLSMADLGEGIQILTKWNTCSPNSYLAITDTTDTSIQILPLSPCSCKNTDANTAKW